MLEVMKQAIDYIENVPDDRDSVGHIDRSALVVALNQAIAELESQEPDYWLGYGLQAHTEKPFENATVLYRRPPQRTEQRGQA